ncbi:dihydrodipicolinate synthase [Ectothiorhodospira haloalkaliphila]|uniref:4-hydroxy-tetrahydrodipicolinate synthase n=1 Tax=Ectothiorhodospira haloalkaliphila TaxID=421628 RepID=W8L316_9GAMM|nr:MULTISPECIES: 4-hydroxy-tetrahydrodipicolinate synthase [Ectothiorhodospira]AHK78340.1 dihydrodipicolinate synthase [Ectothiorhodospira haloalkaliphila]MCG5495810.1 4-hydroxy-tetrahydrodipicolinate synthase [Ectothiorhodospira variabilis]MCG5498719.1 4-hydroxy-tetrahydrodipicolinate synthase [Ectothiorhodospira variabilis]MCG5504756.1 4-hydroxy-tetrahydrodipicolinate synthase [Ectothiorhodospira variabilis]MCG5507913.1 4-hydroxy-tetrahydrodipicolinate synthase [Ectothiorhodospira variabilis
MFHGSMVALATPMNEDGSLAEAALEALVEFHVDNGTDAIVAVGTTGESATLDVREHCQVVRQVVEFAKGRVPVIAGTGANSTSEAIELTRLAMQSGADACLLVTPYYNKPTQEGLYRHFKAVADAVPIAQILYNVPGRTAVDLLPETVERLSSISNIIGLKEATGDVQRARDVLGLCGDRLDLYSGDDPTSRDFMLAGGRGIISVTANVAPRAMHEMCKAALAGDPAAAEAAEAPVRGLHQALFVESNPIPVKWALHEMGLIPPGIRLPLTPLSEHLREPLREALLAAHIPLSSSHS